MPIAPYQAVIFDCDGCLVETEAISLDMEIAALAGLGLHYEREEYLNEFMGGTGASWQAAIDTECQRRLGMPLPATFYEDLRSAVRLAYTERLAPVPGALETATRLRGRKAVASSSSDEHLRMVLEHTGLWSAFAPHVYSAYSVHRGKPHPDVYLYASAKLGVAPADCLAIEDSVNGVKAAAAAGMEVWGFTGGGHLFGSDGSRLLQAGAARIVSTWEEASRLLARW